MPRGPRLDEHGEALDGGVAAVEAGRHERRGHLRLPGPVRRRLLGLDGGLHLLPPAPQHRLGLRRALLVRRLSRPHVVAAAALDPAQDLSHHIETRRLARAGEADDGGPQADRLRPGAGGSNSAGCADQPGDDREQGHDHVVDHDAGATSRPFQPRLPGWRKGVDREGRKIAAAIFEQGHVGIVPRVCRSLFGLPLLLGLALLGRCLLALPEAGGDRLLDRVLAEADQQGVGEAGTPQ